MKNFKSRTLALLMALLMMFQLMPVSAFAETFGGDDVASGSQYYSVKFYDYQGNVITERLCEAGSTIEACPEEPTKPEEEGTSYKFTGWEDEVLGAIDGSTVVNSNINAHPVFVQTDKITVTVVLFYMKNGEKVVLDTVIKEYADNAEAEEYHVPGFLGYNEEKLYR